jgi:cbb3-type cytochrome oxidase subunit 1
MAGFFMKAAVIYGIIGFALGVYMGANHEFAFRSIHSHLSLLGWATFAVCAFYYQVVPSAAGMTVAKVHFWAANIGLVVLILSLVLLSLGMEAAGPGAAAGSVISFAGLAMFLYVVFSTSRTEA